SNFPIHLFDAPLPRWPTFAIDLVYPENKQQPEPDDKQQSEKDPIFLPTRNNQALRPRYQKITGDGPLADLSRFLFAIIGTRQTRRYLVQGRAPGYRDRIGRISLDSNEGGMNLNMRQPILDGVVLKGTAAAERLASCFDFNNHFWVRYRNAASAIERFT